MKLIAWNCRGLGNGPAVRGLLEIQKREDLDILFLSETKLDERRIKHFKWVLGMKEMVIKDCKGKSGGLAMFWKDTVKAELHNFSKYHIDIEIIEYDNFRWRFTGIYGEPASDKKERTFNLLRDLSAQLERPWICVGDFNEILYGHEKEGGPPRIQAHMDKFKETLEECGLQDLGYEGDIFTWRNHSHLAEKYIKERLDRAVANMEWCDRFPGFKVINGDPRHSDHRPIIVETEGRYFKSRRGTPHFRFEANWVEEENCETIIENA